MELDQKIEGYVCKMMIGDSKGFGAKVHAGGSLVEEVFFFFKQRTAYEVGA